MPTPSQALVLKLASSGLTSADGKRLHIQAYTIEQCEALKKKCGARWTTGEGALIPYFDHDGKETNFWRYRYFSDVRQVGFAQATETRAFKYMQAPNTVNQIYMPPLVDWAAVAQDVEIPITFTEGEFKSAKACAMGMPTIGLGGVSMFAVPSKGLELLPQFKKFQWGGRTVRIVYDSDVSTNPKVAVALNAFAYRMTMEGAHVICGTLPPGPEGSKQGLDDYLLHADIKQFEKEIIATAAERGESKAMHEMNDRAYIIRSPLSVVTMEPDEETGKMVEVPRPVQEFKHLFANVKFLKQEINTKFPEKTKSVLTQCADPWLQWPMRQEHSKFTYVPGQGKVYKGMRNRWKGWRCEAIKGDVGPFLALLGYMFLEEPGQQWYFERLLGYPIKYPGTKLNVAAVLVSVEQGTGKSTIGYTMETIYGENYVEISETDLTGNYNTWSVDRQFVMGEEISSGDLRPAQFSALLKGLITRKKIMVKEKYIKEYQIPDTVNYYFTTNHINAFRLEDSDRRMFVIEIRRKPLPKQFYRDYWAWLSKPESQSALRWYFENLDYKGFSPTDDAPKTEARARMLKISYSDLGDWVRNLKERPGEFYAEVQKRNPARTRLDMWGTEDLLMYMPPDIVAKILKKNFNHEMAVAGFTQAVGGKQVGPLPDFAPSSPSLWIIRNPDKWLMASRAEVLAHMLGRPGPLRTAKGKK